MQKNRGGFTLLELLIVLGIVVVVSGTVLLVLNPAELVKQSRDASRISQLKTIDKALSIFLADANSASLGDASSLYVSVPDPAATSTSPTDCASLGLPALPSGWRYVCAASSTLRNVDGTGWIPVNFTLTSFKSVLSVLPADPVNTPAGGFYFTYVPGSWELTANMESQVYKAGGKKDVETRDSGDSDARFEIGTNLALTPDIGDGDGSAVSSAPTADSAFPSSGSSLGGTSVSIYGENFTATPGVTFGGTAATDVLFISSSSLTATTPAHSSGTVDVLVTNPGGQSGTCADCFTYTPIAANPSRYWVGGTGNWSDSARWASSSGGAGGASVPTGADDVYFDSNSFTSGGQIMTVNAAAQAKSINWTGATNNPTFAGASSLAINGSLTLISGMTRTYTGTLTFAATSTGQTITLAGKSLGGAVVFNGAGGEWTLEDGLNVGTASVTLTAGSLNTNGQAVAAGSFLSSNSNARTLTLGSSVITLSGGGTPWNLITATNLTLNPGLSTIVLTGSGAGFAGGGSSYNNVSITGAGSSAISGTNTFVNFTRTGTAAATDGVWFYGDQTITGALTLAGNSAANRLMAQSSVFGTPRTLTAANVSIANADFRDITAVGAAAPFGGTSIGDSLGNTNITFTAASTRYWIGNAGNWNNSAEWSASSGGAGGASAPLPQDTVIFDANSFTTTGQTVTVNMPRLGSSVNFTGVTNIPTLSFSSLVTTVYGSFTLASGMTISGTQTLIFEPRSAAVLTSAGKTFTNALVVNALGGSLDLGDALVTNSIITLNNGTFNANDENVTALSFASSNSNIRSIIMGSGEWIMTGTGTIWNLATVTNLTFAAGNSTLVSSTTLATARTFLGGGLAYNNFELASTGTGVMTVSGSNTFANFTVSTPPKSVTFTNGTTQTITGTLTLNGSAGNLITLRSNAAAPYTLDAAITSLSYVDVQWSMALGAASPFACGATCVDSGNNTNWSF